MNKKYKLLIIISLFVLILPMSVFAHPGRTDAQGCHTCKKNCSSWGLTDGEYHCHNKPITAEMKEARTEARHLAGLEARK